LAQKPEELFCVRILNKYLLYAPRLGFMVLLNGAAVRAVSAGLEGAAQPAGELAALVEMLRGEEQAKPAMRCGPLTDPMFLGLIPTRGCNLNCQYCDFAAPKQTSPRMSRETARRAIDAYLRLLHQCRRTNLEIHFFGGEPFYAWEAVFFAVEYARLQAREQGLECRFEAITNGMFDEKKARWIAEAFDTVVLSLDGFEAVQERQRPSLNGKPTYPTILRNAHILMDGGAEFALRACISEENVEQMVDFAAWVAQELRPNSLCFETLAATPLSRQAGLRAADPLRFVQNFWAAKRALASQGIETILSTDAASSLQESFCPVGKDALIVSPDGSLDACYWLREQWRERGLDLHLGEVGKLDFEFEPGAVQRAREAVGVNKLACQDCLCQYSCAGGCHVRRGVLPSERNNAEVCTQTRAVKIARLLGELGQEALAESWLQDRSEVEKVVYAASDRLAASEALR
jgi:radical SAM protein with 4Fe4S-binding SPASM domain